jgi:hypothetical protein
MENIFDLKENIKTDIMYLTLQEIEKSITK